MRELWRNASVGLLVLAGILSAWGVARYVSERRGGDEGYTVYALFGDAQGLIEKSRVVIAGIPVGTIESIRLEGDRARVDIRVRGDVPLYEDARVTMRQVSILGEAVLVLHPGTKGRRRLRDGERIATVEEGTGTDRVLRTVAQISEDVRAVTHQLERAFGRDEAGDQMAGALRDLSEALRTVNESLRRNEAVVDRTLDNLERVSTAGGDQVLRILEHIERLTKDLRDVVATNRGDLDRAAGDVDETVGAIRRAAEKLERVVDDVGEVTSRTARGEGTIGRLTSDETLIDEVEGVVEGAGQFVGGITRLQTIVELRSEYNVLANTFKSTVSLRLQPREDRYYLIQLIDDPRGRTRFSQTTVRSSPATPENPPFRQETRVTRTDAFRFTMMFAKRIGPFAFRFGIMESSGGLGLDLHLLDDRLEVNTDVFAVGEQAYPRLRVRAAVEVVSRLWVLMGVDDILNGPAASAPQSGGRDAFLGAMLRFNDEDLKTILPFAGGVSSSL